MKSIRNSNIFGSNRRSSARKSVVGAFSTFERDIYRDIVWTPHEEQAKCVEMYNRNSYAQSAVNTMKDFIKGGDIVVKSKDEKTRKRAQAYLDGLDIDTWLDESIENTIKTGNGYVEGDFADATWKKPIKFYAIADSSRIYINCDEFGLPKKKEITRNNPVTGEPERFFIRDDSEFYIQRVDANFRNPEAKWFDINYHIGSQFKKFRIYGIPINKNKIIHFRLNLGDTGVYGRSYMASALDDYESLRQIERSIAVIAKYKAVPRDIIMYGDKDNPATDDELDDFIVYLESLEKEESAIVNKPIKRESLSYAGQDINLDYMMKHVTKKIISGIAPDFMMGVGDKTDNQSSQIKLISYILAIYSKRKLFLRPVERLLLKPFLIREKLEPETWLEFGELDFETKSEKTNRTGALWVQNLITLNEARTMLGMPVIGDEGDVYYIDWQSSMMEGMPGMGGMGFGNLPSPEMEETPLSNNEPIDKVFSHNDPANRKPAQQGGKMPFDPYQKTTDVPKFLPKTDLGRPGQERKSILNTPLPEHYNLESNRDYSKYIDSAEKKKHKEKITIEIDDAEQSVAEDLKTKKISFDTLMTQFGALFKEPRITEIYYKELDNGIQISFHKDGILIYCSINDSDIIKFTVDEGREVSDEDAEGIVKDWKNYYLNKAIREE